MVIFSRLKRLVVSNVNEWRASIVHWTKPLTSSLPLGTLADLARSKPELVAENALLRQQIIMLKRQVTRPACTKKDRILLALLARAVRAWKQALFIVQEDDPSDARIVKHFVCFGGASQELILTSRRELQKPSH